MRYLHILALHFEHILEHRARSFVWFLVSLFNPLLFILFWSGAFQNRRDLGSGWTFSYLTSYYFLLTIASAFLTAHVEEDIAEFDIAQGELVKYIMRPFSYYWSKFCEEIHYRVLQGMYGVIVLIIFFIAFGSFVKFSHDPLIILLSTGVVIQALFLFFTFKMIIGLTAFWMVEVRGLFQVMEATLAIFAGYIMPIELFSHSLSNIAYLMPFSYMIYFPVVAFLGRLNASELIKVLLIQLAWLIFFIVVYKIIWKKGLLKFSGVGQ